MNKCECGCGLFTNPGKRFIRWHSSKMPKTEEIKRKMSEASLGKPKSLEARKKMSIAKTGMSRKPFTEETLRKMSEVQKGRPKSEETKRKIAETLRGQIQTSEQRRKNSLGVSKAWLDGKMENSKHNQYGTFVNYAGIIMRSKMEAWFAYLLDQKEIKWSYEPKRFLLPDGRTYKPDFYLPEFDIWVEVKGYWKGLDKVDLLRSIGKYVTIVLEKDLIEIHKQIFGSCNREKINKMFSNKK